MQKIPDNATAKPEPSSEIATRRMAIKRIATIVSGAAAAAGGLGRANEAWAQTRYTSIGPIYASSYYASMQPGVYGSYQPRYSSSYLSYYTSYRSHYSSVPPPYIPRR